MRVPSEVDGVRYARLRESVVAQGRTGAAKRPRQAASNGFWEECKVWQRSEFVNRVRASLLLPISSGAGVSG